MTPASVTLTGPQAALANSDPYLATAPINLTNHYTDFTVDTPLIVPRGLTAVNDQGEIIQSVRVKISITPVTGYLVLERELIFLNMPPGARAAAEPGQAAVLLIGPHELLAEIDKNPQTVQVQVDLAKLPRGTYTLPVLVQAPQGIQVQLFPKEVTVVIQ